MLQTLHKTIQRVSDLITEYDEGEDRHKNPNSALHDFIQKLKIILSAKNEIKRNDETNYSNLEQTRNNNESASSSSFPQTDASDTSINTKVIEGLGNHVVLTEIFKFGSYLDLNNFRLINKQWKEIANSTIIQRRLWRLSINDKFSIFDSSRNEVDKALVELNNCIEASGGSFPLTTLDFTDVNYYTILNSASLLRFYALMGQNIKHVIFSNFGYLNTNEFQDLLVNKMPKVDHISAGKIFVNNNKEFSLSINLPYLRKITFIHDELNFISAFDVRPYCPVLLLAAMNLKEILNFKVQLTDAAMETGKMVCVKTFNFALEMRTYLKEVFPPLYVKFSHSEPKLTSLTLSRGPFNPRFGDDDDDDDDEDEDNVIMVSPELSQCLQRILISSKDTLKHLHLVPGFFPVHFELPKFPNLEFFSVIDNDDYDRNVHSLQRVFPAGCDCSEIFPNLHTVSLNVIIDETQTLYNYFPNQAFPSVKTLELSHGFQLGSSLKTYFPNVSHIKISDFERLIWCTNKDFIKRALPFHLDNQIESLEFHQCVLFRPGLEFQLDSLFTGVPAYICASLLGKQNDCNVTDVEDKDNVFVKEILKIVQTQHYAFRNSEGLRRLKLIFNHQDNAHFRISKKPDSDLDSDDSEEDIGSDDEKVETSTPVISPISCAYGFSLMRNLEQVIIGYDHYLPNAADIAEVFKPFAQFPYIKIIHEPTI